MEEYIMESNKLRDQIKNIILNNIVSDSPYAGLDKYSVDDAVNGIMVLLEHDFTPLNNTYPGT